MSKTPLEIAKELVKLLEEKEQNVQLRNLHNGETFRIGKHDFIVLDQISPLGQTLVISKGFMAENVVFDDNSRDYKKSNLRKVLEENILPEIEKQVGSDNIVEHYVDLKSVDMQNEFDTCKCKIRPLTFDEARKYNPLLVNCDLDDWWWTCTPWSTEKRGWDRSMAVVAPSGNISRNFCDCYDGVRPFCILKSNIFVSRGE